MNISILTTLSAVVIMVSTPQVLSAQKPKTYPKNDVSVEWGIVPATDFLNLLVSIASITAVNEIKTTDYGSYSLSYNRRLAKMVGLGTSLTYAAVRSDITFKSDETPGFRASNYYSITVNGAFHWVDAGWFSFYSKIGLGLLVFDIKDEESDGTIKNRNTNGTLAMQLSPIGLQFGKDLSFFLEAGFGNKGIGVAGLRYQF